MFSMPNYGSPAQHKHNIDQCVSVMHHLLKLGWDCKRLPLSVNKLKGLHSKCLGNSMSKNFKNMSKINIGIIPL